MAPEPARGRSKDVGAAADVYALGAILHEMAARRPPFKAETPLDALVQAVTRAHAGPPPRPARGRPVPFINE
jgi:serine/threonine protein kinase